MVQVLYLVEHEQTFSTFFFMKSKLKNHLNEHLHIVAEMYSQTFYTLTPSHMTFGSKHIQRSDKCYITLGLHVFIPQNNFSYK
jgi:hypothetical protein